ncbi:efflux RND transporter periplasmic adaptor subunit [Yoonia sp. R2-816]|uniref:efflux RND transporter periplasmic adaptor subunit n=1 Tax=Yoonia sp. R2-816 TaxID=3342638 RepID=UPI00372CD3F8
MTALSACWEEEVATPEAEPRTVRTIVAQEAEASRTRSFPAVLQPPEITHLAFDVGGRLGPIDLRIGQEISQGDVLATVEADDAGLRLEQAEAALQEAQTTAQSARVDADRQVTLFERGVASVAARDRAVALAEQAEARVTQALRNLDLVQSSLGDTTLRAPFDGIIDGINVQAFGSVQPGQPILTLYEDTGLQASVLVSFDVVSDLQLGQSVRVIPSDGVARELPATLTEIGRRAAAVSSFPVVVSLDETLAELRSGMAVAIEIDMPIPAVQQGIEVPLSAVALNRDIALDNEPRQAQMFVARPEAEGLAKIMLTDVTLGTVVGDDVYVTEGLSPGDLVVTAGVSFLNPGQVVRLPGKATTLTAEVTQ